MRSLAPHHVFSRGAGWLDIRCNICRLCVICHNKVHDGNIDDFTVLKNVAEREKVAWEDISDVVAYLRRLPKESSPSQIVDLSDVLGQGARMLLLSELLCFQHLWNDGVWKWQER